MNIYLPSTPEYESATTPHNSSAVQKPALVARPTTAEEVSEIIRDAATRGLTVLPQATGHGAGGVIGDDVVLLDTSGLVEFSVDPESQTASAGPGL